MLNKRGDFMALYLPMITLVSTVFVFGMHYVYFNDIQNSLVSPRAVLDIRDSEEIFNLNEIDLIRASVCGVGFDNVTKIKDKFCSDFSLEDQEGFMEFLSGELIYEDRNIEEAILTPDSLYNFCLALYSFEISGDTLVVSRDFLGKSELLVSSDSSKINFPVDFEYEFDGKHLINLDEVNC